MSLKYDIDRKQKKLIMSWCKLSKESDNFYVSFMSEWIAFNAICYALYYENALKARANLDSGTNNLGAIRENITQDNSISSVNTKIIVKDKKLKFNIEVDNNVLKLSISDETYSENLIFDMYAKMHEAFYRQNTSEFNEVFENLRASLKRNNGRSYVINMAHIKQYDKYKDEDVDEMAARNIIVLCELNNLRTIKNVLYQIRCNIFHGEKTLGDFNDDRIVKSALPLLRFLVNHLIREYKIEEF